MADHDDERPEAVPEPVLDLSLLLARARAEVSRVYRLGGFLSVVVLNWKPALLDPAHGPERVREAGQRLRAGVRAHDSVGQLGPSRLVLLAPGANQAEAAAAARRALAMVAGESVAPAVGIATCCGEVDGGADALIHEAGVLAEQTAAGGVRLSSTLAGRPRVLVVDDDAPFAGALADTIGEMGWEAHPCTDTTDAKNRIEQPGYHGLFLDVVMPGRMGTELLKASIRSFPKRPAVLMSGRDLDVDVLLDALSVGPVTFARKPLSGADVAAALEMFRSLLPRLSRPGTRRG